MSGNVPPVLSCHEVQELAGELGLGVLVGAERAAVLVHLQDCEACRVLVEDMAELGDSVLLLGPLREPPAGFESRLLERWQANTRPVRSPRRRLALVLGSVSAAFLAAGGVVAGLAVTSGSSFQVEHPSAIKAVGGRELSMAVLSDHGNQVGQAFLYWGAPSWLFMTVDTDQVQGRVTCVVQTTGGENKVLGTFQATGSYRAWGATIEIPPRQLQSVRLLDAQGRQVAFGTF